MTASDMIGSLVREGIARAVARPSSEPAAVVGGIEVAASPHTTERAMRAAWRKRVGNSAVPFLLVADDPARPGRLRALGPATHKGPVRSVSADQLAGSLKSLASVSGLRAVRQLAADLSRIAGDGLTVNGLLTRHTLEYRFKGDTARWSKAQQAVAGLPRSGTWHQMLAALGYGLERLPRRGYLAVHGTKPVAVVHPKRTPQEFARLDRDGRPPEGLLASDCKKRGARYGILVHECRFRLFDTDPGYGTGHWLELDHGLLAEERRPFLALLAPPWLAEGGFAELEEEARSFGVTLSVRLDRTIRHEALPALAAGMECWAEERHLDLGKNALRREMKQAALTLLFRIVFMLFSESAGHLPMGNEAYRKASLSALVAEAMATMGRLSPASSALWDGFVRLVKAMRSGNPAWDVPAYNGALFAARDFEGAALLEEMELRDLEFARVLAAVGHDVPEGRGVDFSTLEIAHIGHTYESLLGLELSLAGRAPSYDANKDRYVQASSAEEAEVRPSGLLWQTHSGGRKAGGVYYTPVEIVRHLVRQAVKPPFERHLAKVAGTARTDPAEATKQLLSFAVVDPACGSAHFLVQVAETLAEMTVRFLAEHPLPPLSGALERLRSRVPDGVACEDAALLRRLIVKHCIFGVDKNRMGAEVARLSLWLASFVPGLSLAYLGRNVVVGDALVGVGDPKPLLDEAPLFEGPLREALEHATAAVGKLAEINDRTPEEVAASKAADKEAWAATAGLKRLFDLWTAEQFDLDGAREYVATSGAAVISGERKSKLVRCARELSKRHQFLHWPLAFPQVFSRPLPGFDVVVGNPPWEEVTVEETSFYSQYLPGITAWGEKERKLGVRWLVREWPELSVELEDRKRQAASYRRALAAGDYISTGSDPDLYKYFCQRYRVLLRKAGSIGVVLPRTAFNAKSSLHFRHWLYAESTTRRIDFLVNDDGWIFDTSPRYSIALVVADNTRPAATHRFEIAATASSRQQWLRQSERNGVRSSLSILGPRLETPPLCSLAEADLLVRIRTGDRFPHGSGGRWSCFPVAELHETKDKKLWRDGGDASLWKGASFRQYDPHGNKARPCPTSGELLKKVRKSRPGLRSLLAQNVVLEDRRRAVLDDLGRPRVAFHDVARATDPRTVIACMVPKGVFLSNTAPYLSFPTGDARGRAACLGVMNSLPFDWQARRFVELHVNFFLLEALYVPTLSDDDYDRIARAAARLSAVDDRFADFARETGVECGPITARERTALRFEIDARVARAWDLSPDDLGVMYDNFTENAVPPAYRTSLSQRLAELG